MVPEGGPLPYNSPGSLFVTHPPCHCRRCKFPVFVMAHCRRPIHHHHRRRCRRIFLLLFLPATITRCTTVYTRCIRGSIFIFFSTTIYTPSTRPFRFIFIRLRRSSFHSPRPDVYLFICVKRIAIRTYMVNCPSRKCSMKKLLIYI